MGELAKIFLRESEQRKPGNQLELYLETIPVAVDGVFKGHAIEGIQTYLEPWYKFSELADAQNCITIGRFDSRGLYEGDIDALHEEIEKKGKLHIPSPQKITGLEMLINPSRKTVSLDFNELHKEFGRICDERYYSNSISRTHAQIVKRGCQYWLKKANGGQIMAGTLDSTGNFVGNQVKDEVLLTNESVFQIGYLAMTGPIYPIRFLVRIKNPMEDTRKVFESFPFKH